MSLSALFIDVKTLPDDGYGFFQLLFLGGAYAYILCYASNMISDGSELLLLIPSVAGLVGSVVLPVLGAVPDGAIVLFSGIGPDAQEQLTIGIGALAGSTIMLLTAPWFLSVLGGRVNIVDGKASYTSPKLYDPEKDPKESLPTFFSWTDTGVDVSENVNTGGLLMAVTAIPFLIIQIPGLIYGADTETMVGEKENPYALVAMIACGFFFFGYLYYQYLLSDQELNDDKRIEQIIEKIQRGEISLRGVINAELRAARSELGESSELVKGSKARKAMEAIVKPFFRKYDKKSNNWLSLYELSGVFKDMGESPPPDKLRAIFDAFDIDKNGKIEYAEFVEGITKYVAESDRKDEKSGETSKFQEVDDGDVEMLIKRGEEDGNPDDADEEDMPDDFVDLSPDEQQAAVAIRASWICGVGTILVVLFSDPMVDVLNELGARTGIPQFYVAFVLAPLASNASEVIASFNYAQKKTAKSMAISLSALQGACCMNNTFVLGIFMICVYTQSLAWQFFAETVSTLVSILFISIMSLKPTHTMFDALLIMMVYPLSLVLVYVLEANGWD